MTIFNEIDRKLTSFIIAYRLGSWMNFNKISPKYHISRKDTLLHRRNSLNICFHKLSDSFKLMTLKGVDALKVLGCTEP